MRIAILASGSRGNAALIEHGSSLVLLDCGISLRKIEQTAKGLGVSLSDITAVCITHEHADHIKSLRSVIGQIGRRPLMTRGTANRLKLNANEFTAIIAFEETSLSDSMSMIPYAVPHDAREPVQCVFKADNMQVGFATDIGQPTERIAEQLSKCQCVVLECNYDPTMLENNNAYPRVLKQRISGGHGHMSNDEGAFLLAKIAHAGLRDVVAAHLSENNNMPKLAMAALQATLGRSRVAPALHCASQDEPTGWIEIKG